PQLDAPDLVEAEGGVFGVAVQRVDVQSVLDVLDQGAGRAGGVLDRQLLTRLQRGGRHPADHGVDVLGGRRGVVDPGDHVAAGDVDIVLEADGHRHRWVCRRQFLAEEVDGFDGGGHPRGQDDDLVTGLEHSTGDRAAVAAVVVVVVRLGSDDVLDGEADVAVVAVAGDVDVFEVVHEGGALVPVHVGGPVDHVVALQCGDRDDFQVGDVEFGGEGGELVQDRAV